MTEENDDPKKAEAQEFQRRIDNGSITAKEMISKTLDIHKHNTAVFTGLSSSAIESNLISACRLKGLFLYIVYQTNSSKSKYFQSVIDRIEDKYFNDTRNGEYASADTFSFEIGHYTFVVMKKNRITKEQIAEELYQDRDEDFRKREIESIKQANPIIYFLTNGIPFYTHSEEDNQAMRDKINALFRKHKAQFG